VGAAAAAAVTAAVGAAVGAAAAARATLEDLRAAAAAARSAAARARAVTAAAAAVTAETAGRGCCPGRAAAAVTAVTAAGAAGGGFVASHPSRYPRAYLSTPGWVLLVLVRYSTSPSLDNSPFVPVPYSLKDAVHEPFHAAAAAPRVDELFQAHRGERGGEFIVAQVAVAVIVEVRHDVGGLAFGSRRS
jgi:hypothetical protein